MALLAILSTGGRNAIIAPKGTKRLGIQLNTCSIGKAIGQTLEQLKFAYGVHATGTRYGAAAREKDTIVR